jgi:hypothetical protein
MRAIDCPCGHRLKRKAMKSCSASRVNTSTAIIPRCSGRTSKSGNASAETPTTPSRSYGFGRGDAGLPRGLRLLSPHLYEGETSSTTS